MLSEVVRKHLLKERKTPLNDDDLEIAVHVGWAARNDEIERLQAENARYIERIEELTSELSKLKVQADRHREALEFTLKAAEYCAYPIRQL